MVLVTFRPVYQLHNFKNPYALPVVVDVTGLLIKSFKVLDPMGGARYPAKSLVILDKLSHVRCALPLSPITITVSTALTLSNKSNHISNNTILTPHNDSKNLVHMDLDQSDDENFEWENTPSQNNCSLGKVIKKVTTLGVRGIDANSFISKSLDYLIKNE